ncbi:hypothetical protein JHK84_041062 [Glycine max]|nr:hypothetical protein JHK85_041455 [Glycine max]KAG5122722.1 hypothetical protein JHK84_041062 [Glycine max]
MGPLSWTKINDDVRWTIDARPFIQLAWKLRLVLLNRTFLFPSVKSTTTLLSSGETFKKFGEFQVPRMLYLSKGCGCEVVLFLWFCCYLLLTAGQITEPTEVDALRAIKRSLIDINGSLSSWDHGDPCASQSEWKGITCSNTTLVDDYLHVRQFHMNNNSLSGQILPELFQLGSLVHLLLDNNNFTGYLPPEFSEMPSLRILQLDNNDFGGNSIPESYGNISKLSKLSLRNCNLQGPIPDFSRIPHLAYLDLSNNKLTGTIPSSFSGLPRLQKLSFANNSLSGYVPSTIWQDRSLNGTERLILLEGNPVCTNNNTLVQFCGPEIDNGLNGNYSVNCPSQECPSPYEYTVECFCVAPLVVHYRLKSPGFSDFRTYERTFESFLTDGLNVDINQLFIKSFAWEEGPRLRMNLKLFPECINNKSYCFFSTSEVIRIRNLFRDWGILSSDLFGPYELLDFIVGPYRDVISPSPSSWISKGALVGIVLGAIACAITLSAIVSILILRIRLRDYGALSRQRNDYSCWHGLSNSQECCHNKLISERIE